MIFLFLFQNIQPIFHSKAYLSTHMSANFKKNCLRKKIKSKLFKWSCRGSLKEFCLDGFFASLCQRKAGLDPLLGSCCHNSGWQFTLKILFSSFPGKQVKVKPTNCSWQVPYCCSLSFKLAIWVLCSICEWASRAGNNRVERVLTTEGKRRSSLMTRAAVWHHHFRQKEKTLVVWGKQRGTTRVKLLTKNFKLQLNLVVSIGWQIHYS